MSLHVVARCAGLSSPLLSRSQISWTIRDTVEAAAARSKAPAEASSEAAVGSETSACSMLPGGKYMPSAAACRLTLFASLLCGAGGCVSSEELPSLRDSGPDFQRTSGATCLSLGKRGLNFLNQVIFMLRGGYYTYFARRKLRSSRVDCCCGR